MAPFLYQESYGAAQIRGNEDLQNGYNYNFDLRYERFGDNGDMFSVTGYFKHLDNPIERIQRLQGGATMHSFQNADQGMATGIEAEVRKTLVKDLRLGANVSYMYTNVKLPEGGAYTNKERSLQGASPILLNADLTYSPRFGEDRQLNLALLYNLQGKRIHAVGVSQLGDIKEQTRHTMNFRASYAPRQLRTEQPLHPQPASGRPAEPRHRLQARRAQHRRSGRGGTLQGRGRLLHRLLVQAVSTSTGTSARQGKDKAVGRRDEKGFFV